MRARPEALEIAPVLVFAPCWRCGTTLVQRLLNSSGRIVIYGEDQYLLNMIATTWQLAHDRRMHQSSLRTFLKGNTETWSNAVLPNPAEYAECAVDSFHRQLRRHQDWSESNGFARWGFKSPLQEAELVRMAAELMPGARIIFVYRNPYEVASSAKARRFVADAHELRALARRWSRNVTWFLESGLADTSNVLSLRYEHLIQDRRDGVALIEEFCGVEGIRADVFERKINAPIGSTAFGDFPTGYVEPAALNAEERAIIADEAADALQILYDAVV